MRGSKALRLLWQLNAGAHKLTASQPGAVSSTAAWLTGSTPASSVAVLPAQTQAFQRRTISSSPASAAAAAAAHMQVQGDLSAILSEVDAVVSREDSQPKDIADAAMALAYLQARGDRRLWGKLFERASAAKAEFDAASITAFLWAATTAGVGHFKTAYELAGPTAKLLGSFTPAQLSTVVEALGRAGVNDVDLMKAVSSHVVSKAGNFSASQLSKVLYGFAAAGCPDVALTKAVLAALGGKAGAGATATDLSQVVYALAKMSRNDSASLSGLSKALAGKLGGGEAAQDVLAAVWGFAHLNTKPDATLLSKAATAVKGASSELSNEQKIYAAWSFALLGHADKDLYAGLFKELGAILSTAPDSVSVPLLGRLAEAQLMVSDKLGAQAPKLPDQVTRYAQAMHGVVSESEKVKAGSAGAAFKAAVAEATARATGARYKPEIAAAVAGLSKTTADGLPVELAVDSLKVAVLPVDAGALSSSKTPLGPVAARMELLKARGYTPVVISAAEFAPIADKAAQAKYILSAIKSAAGSSSQLSALEKKLAEPFDPYAD